MVQIFSLLLCWAMVPNWWVRSPPSTTTALAGGPDSSVRPIGKVRSPVGEAVIGRNWTTKVAAAVKATTRTASKIQRIMIVMTPIGGDEWRRKTFTARNEFGREMSRAFNLKPPKPHGQAIGPPRRRPPIPD